jgi:hydrogenase maturation factor
MNDEQRNPQNSLRYESIPVHGMSCSLDSEGHCITCSDEALLVTVLRIDSETGLALVEVQGVTEEVDTTLVESVAPGDTLLVHGGVAIGHVGEVNEEEG